MDWCFGVFGLVWFLFGCLVVDFRALGCWMVVAIGFWVVWLVPVSMVLLVRFLLELVCHSFVGVCLFGFGWLVGVFGVLLAYWFCGWCWLGFGVISFLWLGRCAVWCGLLL